MVVDSSVFTFRRLVSMSIDSAALSWRRTLSICRTGPASVSLMRSSSMPDDPWISTSSSVPAPDTDSVRPSRR